MDLAGEVSDRSREDVALDPEVDLIQRRRVRRSEMDLDMRLRQCEDGRPRSRESLARARLTGNDIAEELHERRSS